MGFLQNLEPFPTFRFLYQGQQRVVGSSERLLSVKGSIEYSIFATPVDS